MKKKAISEAEFQSQVIQFAKLRGWRVAHFRPARTGQRWSTPVAADGAGFPDLVLAKDGRVIFAELKSATGKLSTAQMQWQAALSGGDVVVAVWRPCDWKEIETLLR